jgi:mannose-1-phosphate guanylyltransferase/mannose-1-phosphate guanylyltransferase/mannose-6-phosphate isomerase
MVVAIMSGGSGTRLWPISRTQKPKQFSQLFEKSLQNMTIERLLSFGEPWVITSESLRTQTEISLKQCGVRSRNVLYEPSGKNTAPAIALLCRVLQQRGLEKEVVGIFPADHLIGDEKSFKEALEFAESCARDGKVVTLGLKPTEPNTGYGYIQTKSTPYTYKKSTSSYSVAKFHEKPSLAMAKEFLREGHFYWNAGIFVFPVYKMIEHFEKYQPQIWDLLEGLRDDLSNLKEIYAAMPSISVDYAIMEKLGEDSLLCVPCDPNWSDVGSWDAVAEVYVSSGRSKGSPVEVNSKNNFVLPHRDRNYAFVGVDDLIVVDTEDALLIAKRGSTQDVKLVVDRLKAKTPKLVEEHRFEERPWGQFEILRDSDYFKSKKITVEPGQQLSLQSHAKREEHWIIVKGIGEVVLNDQVIAVKYGSHIHIPPGAKHRMKNTGAVPLEFIEVQMGSYFGEDDIVRYQDDYNRK